MYKNYSFVKILIILSLFILSNCSSLPVSDTGQDNFFDVETDKIINSLITYLPIDSKVLIYDLTDLNGVITHFGRYLAQKLYVKMSNLREIKLIDRKGIDLILKEQELQMSEAIEPSSVVEIGKLIGANFIVYGTLSELSAVIDIDFRIVNVEKGTVIGGTSHQIEKTREVARLVGSIIKSQEQQQKELAAYRETVLMEIEKEKDEMLRKIQEEETNKKQELKKLEEQIREKSIIIAEYEKKKAELQESNAYIKKIHREIDSLNWSVLEKLKIGMTLKQVISVLGNENVHKATNSVYVVGRYFLVFNGVVLGKVVKIEDDIDDPYAASARGKNICIY
jgi:hypothetical protein